MKIMILRIATLFFLLTVFTTDTFSQGYKIKVKINGVAGDTVQLGYYFEDKQYIAQTTTADAKGNAEFSGDKPLPGGLYMIIVPRIVYFDILMSDDQIFNMESDTADIIKMLKISGSDENKVFYEYQNHIKNEQTFIKELENKKKQSPADSTVIQAQIDAKYEALKNYWKQMSETHKGTFFASLIRATNGEPPEAYSEANFFEHIDFSDQRLLRSPVIHRAVRLILARNLNNYKPTETLIKELDMLLAKASADTLVTQYLLNHLLNFFNSFQRVGMNEVFVHLSENYFLDGKAAWMGEKNLEQLAERTRKYKSSFVGQPAPDIEMLKFDGELISLKDVDAQYTFLFFWKVGCGHCEKSAKDIKAFYDKFSDYDFKVFSVSTGKDKKDAEEFIKKNQLEAWINCYDPDDKSDYQILYYVVSTPIFYLIDKDKKIVAKRAGDGPILDMLNQLETQKEKFNKR